MKNTNLYKSTRVKIDELIKSLPYWVDLSKKETSWQTLAPMLEQAVEATIQRHGKKIENEGTEEYCSQSIALLLVLSIPCDSTTGIEYRKSRFDIFDDRE